VEISPSKGGKLQPPLKVVITTLLFNGKSRFRSGGQWHTVTFLKEKG